MQINNLDKQHRNTSHQVTSCIHDNDVGVKAGGAPMKSSTGTDTAVPASVQESLQEEIFSLSGWMQNLKNGGKHLFQRIWGEALPGDSSAAAGKESVDAGHKVLQEDNGRQMHNPGVAAAAGMVQPPDQKAAPYFTVAEDTGEQKKQLWEKVKVRFHSVAGHWTGRFSKSNSFQARKEESREDLRRKSHYKGEEQEVDCVLEDESYLLDSYDRKGEYSTLTTKK